MIVDTDAAIRFLRTAYEADDWIALFLKSYQTGQTLQRVGPLSLFLEPRVHAWLRAMNANQFNCYVAVNSIKHGMRSRTKDAIDTVRHVFIETDTDGAQLLATLAARRDLPTQSYVIESSPNRLHVLWRVSGFTTDLVERLQKLLARQLGTDIAATSCSQTTRVPGYRNHKRMPAALVTIQYAPNDVRHTPLEFPAPPEPLPSQPMSPVERSRTSLGVVERARRYLARVEPAIAGRHGDAHTYQVCCRIARGFALGDADALAALSEWNSRCLPPWSEGELLAKIVHARKYGREPIGHLAGARHRSASG